MELVEREDWDRRFAEREPIHGGEPDPTFVDVAGGLTPGRALDLGCGQGRNALWLAARGWRVTGVDFSRVALEHARRDSDGLPVEWVEADLREYEPAARAYDFVSYVFVQLPAEERAGVLARAAGAVADGGTLLVAVHDLRNLAEGEGGPQDPLVLATPAEIVGELPGLEIERAESSRRDDQIDCVVVARRPALDEG
jgi:SAM-dependent methyltransferase